MQIRCLEKNSFSWREQKELEPSQSLKILAGPVVCMGEHSKRGGDILAKKLSVLHVCGAEGAVNIFEHFCRNFGKFG